VSAIASFRAVLQAAGLDLDADPRAAALAAQGWAGQGTPAASTYNQRLAIVSSFYTFARKRGLLAVENPIGLVERRAVQAYRGVSAPNVRSALASLDRSDLAGLRDYALLAIALTTGRRVAELAGLRWKDVHLESDRVKLSFRRTKGGKTAANLLPLAPGRALLAYLAAAYGAGLGELAPDAPIWLRLDRAAQGRAALSARSLETISQQRLGVHFHALRHSFAKVMESTGAKVSEIQAQLGHENLATTGRYLAALRSAENAHGEQIAAALGIE
jgi:integrase